jgi:hypothetical protein
LEEDEVSLHVREKCDARAALLTPLNIGITANMTAVNRIVRGLCITVHRIRNANTSPKNLSARIRDTTWARKTGDKEEWRQIKNSMGYQISLGP